MATLSPIMSSVIPTLTFLQLHQDLQSLILCFFTASHFPITLFFLKEFKFHGQQFLCPYPSTSLLFYFLTWQTPKPYLIHFATCVQPADVMEENYISKWTDLPFAWSLTGSGTFNMAWRSHSISLGFSLFHPFFPFSFLLTPPTLFTLDLQAPMMTFLFISMREIEVPQGDLP